MFVTIENYQNTPSFASIPRIMMTNVYYKDQLNANALILYTYIHDQVRAAAYHEQVTKNGIAYIKSYPKSFSTMLGISVPTVRSSLDKLIKAELIVEQKGKKISSAKYDPSIYFVKYPKTQQEIDKLTIIEPAI
ncbi:MULTISPECIES: hypothetical protein [unclassified Cytobacillus]|uniref:hypothetical protein n=1 Tax=unclassified Cytobacillus TaxID=2675268 RepID=UPI00203E528D|nr:hypothetical protein [Cytobacillus sp. AMY 15.2]MCM3093858.1 hypothetical protein [Cytobacillus sp. AMY 15.2]